MSDSIAFHAVVEPNRPLGPRCTALLIVLVALASFAASFFYAGHGAWPVTVFSTATAIFFAWAMQASRRASRRREHLILTAHKFRIARVDARGQMRSAELDPRHLRIEHDDPEFLGAELALVAKGRRWIVGAFLGAEERASLAEALRTALRQAQTAT